MLLNQEFYDNVQQLQDFSHTTSGRLTQSTKNKTLPQYHQPLVSLFFSKISAFTLRCTLLSFRDLTDVKNIFCLRCWRRGDAYRWPASDACSEEKKETLSGLTLALFPAPSGRGIRRMADEAKGEGEGEEMLLWPVAQIKLHKWKTAAGKAEAIPS